MDSDGARADHLAAALRLGLQGNGETWPNPSVGTLLVRDGCLIARARTGRGGRPHSEARAIERAGKSARGATAYVSLEPCSHHGRTPPCSEALVAAGVAEVVTAGADPDPRVAGRGHARLAEAGLRLFASLCPEAAAYVHAGHLTRVREGRPFVTLKMAISADGGIGLRGRGQVGLTGAVARRHVHALRSRVDAILVGSGTFLADSPRLDCRLPGLERRSPVRVVLDRRGRADAAEGPPPLWVLREPSAASALRALAKRGITRVLVEGGAEVAGSLFEADLIDEALLIRTERILGEERVPALAGIPLERIEHDPAFRAVDRLRFGSDRMVRYLRSRGGT